MSKRNKEKKKMKKKKKKKKKKEIGFFISRNSGQSFESRGMEEMNQANNITHRHTYTHKKIRTFSMRNFMGVIK